MTSSKTAAILLSLTGSTLAFTSSPWTSTKTSSSLLASSINEDRPIYDPFNLYGANSMERSSGLIRGLEPKLAVRKPILDPMNLYTKNKNEVDADVDMSDSLPFLSRPLTLTREMAGDVGFDPFNFAPNDEALQWQRQAELKHARIAMLAAIGWPLSELYDTPLADLWHLKPLLGAGDRVPSLLNGGLDQIHPIYWVAVLAAASAMELKKSMPNGNSNNNQQSEWGPVGSYSKSPLDVAEIQNGRLAMMAIVGFAVQEFVTKMAVVHQTPMFFHPIIFQSIH